MKHLQTKTYFQLLLLIHFVVLGGIFALNYCVDPYHYNSVMDLEKNEDIALRANYRIYKMLGFRREPQSRILLGDSRIFAFDESEIEAISKAVHFNFSYGGATLSEIIDSFWYADSVTELSDVYLGLSFNIYRENSQMNLVNEARELLAEPLKYYLSPFVAKIALYNILYNASGYSMIKEDPEIDKEKFWIEQIQNTTRKFYRNYQKPVKLKAKLAEIVEYCKLNNIKLKFIIPPTHIELQEQVSRYDLQDEYVEFKEQLALWAETYDFEFRNAYTEKKENFLDPYHSSPSLVSLVIDDIWGQGGLGLSKKRALP